MVTLIDDARQWCKAVAGADLGEVPRELSFCAWAILGDDVLWVADAQEDARFSDNPLVRAAPGLRFYAGAPIRLSDGERVGTVCVLDVRPRSYDLDLALTLHELAAAAGGLLEVHALRRRVVNLEVAAETERSGRLALLKSLAHELMTPLSGVLGGADALRSAELSLEDRDTARLVASSARAMKTIVAELLETAALDDETEKAPCVFELGPLVRSVLASKAAAARIKGLDLTAGPIPNLALVGGAERLGQLLRRLLAGAVTSAPRGRVLLDISFARSGAFADLLVRIEDEGPAPRPARGGETIPKPGEVRQRSFEVAMKMARRLGGELEAAPSADGGCLTLLRLTLSLADGADAPLRPEPQALALGADVIRAPVAGATAPLRILVADDHPANRKVAALILEPLPAEVVLVEDGAQAVSAFASGSFDLVLMDLQMPVMDGLDAIREIRRREILAGRGARVPIIVVSAHVFPSDREASAAAGADAHIGKPVDAAELIETVRRELCEPSVSEPRLADRVA